MTSQVPHTLLMVRPHAFGSNPETAASNAFQQAGDDTTHLRAVKEFDQVISLLKQKDIPVIEIEDTDKPPKPDAVFPNNWFTTHEDGKIILYPMMAASRRLERRADVIQRLKRSFTVREVIDLSETENSDQFLEGTGSIVFDHPNRTAYACHSPRTNDKALLSLCRELNYKPILFHAADRDGKAI